MTYGGNHANFGCTVRCKLLKTSYFRPKKNKTKNSYIFHTKFNTIGLAARDAAILPVDAESPVLLDIVF